MRLSRATVSNGIKGAVSKTCLGTGGIIHITSWVLSVLLAGDYGTKTKVCGQNKGSCSLLALWLHWQLTEAVLSVPHQQHEQPRLLSDPVQAQHVWLQLHNTTRQLVAFGTAVRRGWMGGWVHGCVSGQVLWWAEVEFVSWPVGSLGKFCGWAVAWWGTNVWVRVVGVA